MALSDAQIEQGQKYLKIWQKYTSRPMAAHHLSFAQAIEAEVRKQDDALIRQLVEALEGSIAVAIGKAEQRNTALIAGLAWLESKP